MDGGGGDRGDSLHPGKCFSNINGSFLALAAALLRGRCCLLSAQLNQQQQKRATRRDNEEAEQDSPNQHKNSEFHEINKLDFIATAIHLNYIIITINQSSTPNTPACPMSPTSVHPTQFTSRSSTTTNKNNNISKSKSKSSSTGND